MFTENQDGRSMIEILGVLAIIGVLSVGGIAGYSKAMMQIKINKTIEQITEAYTNIRTMCRDRPCSDAVGPMVSVVYPEDLSGCTEFSYSGHTAYNNCTHALGGGFAIYDDHKNDYTKFFFFGISGLKDKDACIKLTTYDWNFDGFDSITLDTTGGFFTYDKCTPYSYTKNSEDYVEGDYENIVKCDKITLAEAAYFCSNCSEYGCGISLSYYY